MGDDDSKSGKSGSSTSIDVISPYFIPPSDNHGQVFVKELLRDGNYGDWVNEMANALYAKNKIGFVDGTIPMPPNGSSDLPFWKRCNAIVRGWLTSAMEKEIHSSVKYAVTARDIWLDLEERFGKECAPRAYELRCAITILRQNRMTVSSYYTKLRGLWDEIQSASPAPNCTCGGCKCDLSKKLTESIDRQKLYEFLMGLDDEYGTIKTQILSSKPTPSLGFAYHLVAEDEQQRAISAARKPVAKAAAFQTHTQPRQQDNVDWKIRRDSEGDDRKNRGDRFCTHCKRSNHFVENCWVINGVPEEWLKKGKDSKKGNLRALPL